MIATLDRYRKETYATAGIFRLFDEAKKLIFECKTIELPDKNNEPKVSCIPSGSYDCRWSYSPSFKIYTYEILNVPNRSGIRIHAANYSRQLKGCIALGTANADIDKDGTIDVTNSKATIAQFEKLMNGKTLKLTIR